MVRLKENIEKLFQVSPIHLNPTMVRLKVEFERIGTWIWTESQSHYGSIKRIINLKAKGVRQWVSIPLWFD